MVGEDSLFLLSGGNIQEHQELTQENFHRTVQKTKVSSADINVTMTIRCRG